MLGVTLLLRDIRKIYKVGPLFVEVVKGIDLVIEEGETALITGDDNPGRAAIMRILGLIEPPTAGEIFVDDNEITDISEKERCALRNVTFGYISNLVPLVGSSKVIDNVIMPLGVRGGYTRAERRAKAEESLEYVGAADLKSKLAGKLGEEQQQRVSIARAIVGEPAALWIDDPWLQGGTAGAGRILELISQIQQDVGLTMTISADRVFDKEMFDRIINISEGRISVN